MNIRPIIYNGKVPYLSHSPLHHLLIFLLQTALEPPLFAALHQIVFERQAALYLRCLTEITLGIGFTHHAAFVAASVRLRRGGGFMKTNFVRLLALFLLLGHSAGARNFFTRWTGRVRNFFMRCSGRARNFFTRWSGLARNFFTRCSGRTRWSGGCRHVFTWSVLLTHSWCKDGWSALVRQFFTGVSLLLGWALSCQFWNKWKNTCTILLKVCDKYSYLKLPSITIK